MTSPQEYVARGWYVFPCHSIHRGKCTCSLGTECQSPGKHPRTHSGVKDATNNPETVRAWEVRWPDSNWAVACGHGSGIVVIDIDPRKDGFTSIDHLEQNRTDGPLPTTLQSSTGGAGRHLFFQYPAEGAVGNRTNWLPGVDVKADGGYVILPDASHISGGRYSWDNWSSPIAPLPSDILSAIRPGGGGGLGGGDLPDTDSILQGVPEGERDDTLFRAACRWRRQLGEDSKDAVMTLALKAAAACEPAFPEEQAVKCVEQAWKQDHSDDAVEWLTIRQGGFEHLTDLGNAKRFLSHFGDRVRYVDGWGWVKWTDIGWMRGADAYASELAYAIPGVIRDEASAITDDTNKKQFLKWSMKSEDRSRLSAVTALAANLPELRKRVNDFDTEDSMLNCSNGIVNLRTGELRMLDQDDLVTKNTHVAFDPQFRLQQWEDFLEASCEGDIEMMEYLQRAAGYTLTGSNAEECFFIISGPQASGKSTFLDALHSALGTYGTTTQSETFMYRRNQQTPHAELARFAGARLVSMSEIRESDSFDETLVKQFTGGDKVTARYLYQNAFEYRPQLKLWIGTNHDPDAKDEALWRRIKKIPFRRSIPFRERQPALKEILRDPDVGGRAVLAWAVRGAMQWYQTGLSEPASITMEVAAYKQDQDRFGQFIKDCLVLDGAATTRLNDLFETYSMWCKVTNEHRKQQPQFTKTMTSRGFEYDRDSNLFLGVRPRVMTLNSNGVTWQ